VDWIYKIFIKYKESWVKSKLSILQQKKSFLVKSWLNQKPMDFEEFDYTVDISHTNALEKNIQRLFHRKEQNNFWYVP
jgi:hypothetical protein